MTSGSFRKRPLNPQIAQTLYYSSSVSLSAAKISFRAARTRACRVDTRVDACWLHLTLFAACRNVLQLLNFFARCEDSRCLTWRPVGQSPWTARDPLVALPLAITQLSIACLRLRRFVLHLFKFFAAREGFTALVERASKPATPTSLPARFGPRPYFVSCSPALRGAQSGPGPATRPPAISCPTRRLQ